MSSYIACTALTSFNKFIDFFLQGHHLSRFFSTRNQLLFQLSTILTLKQPLSTDPDERLTLEMVAEHPWVIGEDGPLPEFLCWCKQNSLQGDMHKVDTEVLPQDLDSKAEGESLTL